MQHREIAAESDSAGGPETVADLLLRRVGDQHTALRHGDEVWSWDAVVREAAHRAHWFRAQRLAAGGLDRQLHIGVLLDNGPEYLFAFGGVAAAGDVLVALNATRSASQLSDDIAHSGVDIVVTSARYLGKVTGLTCRVVDVDEISWGDEEWIDLSAVPTATDLFALLFTSGSTSRPKAVRHSHGRLLARGRQLLAEVELDRSATVYLHMPMFHASTMFGLLLPAILAGATVATRERFSSASFASDVHAYGATHTTFVGKTLQYILVRTTGDESGSTLRVAVGNGASDRDILRFAEVYGCRVIDVYGSTEGAISLRRVPGTPVGAIGAATKGDVRALNPATGAECPRAVRDSAGRFVNLDEAIGEIVRVDGTGNFEGYYDNAAAERERVRGGQYWSGDLAWRDSDGYFFFAGRAGDMVRVNGENISAHRVQDRVEAYPEVEECLAYGVREAGSDDHLMVTVVLRRGATAQHPDAIFSWLTSNDLLSAQEVPRFVRIAREIPRTATNKLLAEPLRRQGWHTNDPIWWRPSSSHTFERLTVADIEELDRAVLTGTADGGL